jgi:hypothetical protein
MTVPASYVVMAHSAAAVLLAWLYFRRFRMVRPPIGVYNLNDVAIMIGAIVLVPFLYLALPVWLVGGLVLAGSVSILYFTWEPIFAGRGAAWLATVGLAVADVAALLAFGPAGQVFFAINNVILVLTVVGVANLWAQSGMKARDAAILGVVLACYDYVATWLLPLMGDLITRLAGFPFAPVVAWPLSQPGMWLGIGLGDLLMAAVFPLVMRKAFGRSAGIVAMLVGCAALGMLILILTLGLIHRAIPVMIVLGPLMALQYGYWRRRGREYATWQYLQAEPMLDIAVRLTR